MPEVTAEGAEIEAPPGEGTRARLNRYALRSLFALGLYRLSVHAAESPG